MTHTNPILFYDGSCGFCQRSVQFILQHERNETIHFAALESEFASLMKEQYPLFDKVDSIVLLKGKELLVESDAVFELASYLHAPFKYAQYGRVLPKLLRDHIYRFVSRNRRHFVRNNNTCLVPSVQQRKRFLS